MRSVRTCVAIVGVAGTMLPASLGCGAGGGSDGPCGPTSAKVTQVIDGDTIEIEGGDKVRYLLVDAPEITKGHEDCYGHEAASFNATLVDQRVVQLAYDPAQCKDRYGRWLAYVSVDGREVNAMLAERGYACVYYLPPGGTSRQLEFETAEANAKASKAGVWGACDPVPCVH